MKLAQGNFLLLALLSLLLAGNSFAQDAEENSAPDVPDLASLQASVWSFFEGTRAEIEPRAEAFLSKAETEIAKLTPQNEAVANTLLTAVRDI